MRLLTLTSVVLLGLVINNAIRRSNARQKKAQDEFWKREFESYRTPPKPTDDLEYVSFPDDLPLDLASDDPQIREYQEILKNLKQDEVLDLSGISNTDVRLSYGNRNLDSLSRADARYTTLCRSLNNLAVAYSKRGYMEEARTLLEFAVSIGSDIKESHELLSSLKELMDVVS